MSIRRAILWGLIGLVLGTVLVSAALSFFQFRQSLEAEIARNLRLGAVTAQERIDAFFYERLRDLRDWRSLEVMQDIRIDDVDKRLAGFLSDLERQEEGVYHGLFTTNADGRIVAASDPNLIGQTHEAQKPWHQVRGKNQTVISLEPLALSKDPPSGPLLLRTSIPDEFGEGQIGHLYAAIRWSAVQDLLEQAASSDFREALLLDDMGRVLAATGGLAGSVQGQKLGLEAWPTDGVGTRTGPPLSEGSLLIGGARSSGYRDFPGFGWHTLVAEPTELAFAPVWQLLWAIATVLVLTLVGAFLLSVTLSNRITRPLDRLTAFAQAFRRGEASTPPRERSSFREVQELSRAYAKMIQSLDLSYENLQKAHNATVLVLARASEFKDEDTGDHVRRVRDRSERTAYRLRDEGHFTEIISDLFLEQIGMASILHDIGKVGIPDRILQKPGRLDDEEWPIMKSHASIGENILREAASGLDPNNYLSMGADIAGGHHEKFDGTGYPRGLSGEEIPLSGRIVAAVDVYDALTSRRPYKEPWPHADAVRVLEEGSGSQFDPRVVSAFLTILAEEEDSPAGADQPG